MIGGNKPLRADRLVDPREATRDDLIAAGLSLAICILAIAGVAAIAWFGT